VVVEPGRGGVFGLPRTCWFPGRLGCAGMLVVAVLRGFVFGDVLPGLVRVLCGGSLVLSFVWSVAVAFVAVRDRRGSLSRAVVECCRYAVVLVVGLCIGSSRASQVLRTGTQPGPVVRGLVT